jgi:hypothetical protein
MCDISFWMSLLICKLFTSILLIMLMVSSFGILVDIFHISKKYTHIFLLSSILCKSVIGWNCERYMYMGGVKICVMFLLNVLLIHKRVHPFNYLLV